MIECRDNNVAIPERSFSLRTKVTEKLVSLAASELGLVGLWVLAVIAPWLLMLPLNRILHLVALLTGLTYWQIAYSTAGFWLGNLLIFLPGIALAIFLLKNANAKFSGVYNALFLVLVVFSYPFTLLLLLFSYHGL